MKDSLLLTLGCDFDILINNFNGIFLLLLGEYKMEEEIKIGFYYDGMEKMSSDMIFCEPTEYARYFNTRTNYNSIYSKVFGDYYIGNSKYLSSNGYLNPKVQEVEETEDGLMIRPILQMPDSFFNNLTYKEKKREIVKFGKYTMTRVEDS